MMRRPAYPLLAALVLSLALLTGCALSPLTERGDEGHTLPPARQGPNAPVGDSRTAQEISAVLYLPDARTLKLRADVRQVVVEAGKTVQEACVAALLAAVADTDFYTSSQTLQLAVVSNPVETTGDLVTVNLSNSVRMLSGEAMFALRVAITNTLTELPGINYVNILVEGRDVGLDVAETLPTGVMIRYPGDDVSTYWGQIESERVSTELELSKMAALYFISADGGSLLGEARSVLFTERTPAVYARALIEELAKGATQVQGTWTLVPPSEYFDRDPIYSDSDRIIHVYFHPAIDDRLSMAGATRGMLMSSICYTLGSFIPSLNGVVFYVNDDPVTQLTLMDGTDWSSQNGVMTRRQLTQLAADTCTVYFPYEDGSGLCAVKRPITQRMRTQPRVLLRELMNPPGDAALGAALPEGTTEADILGLQLKGDMALVNLSAAFARACAEMTETRERDMVYAIVNTLTEIEGVMRVRFYVNGVQAPLAGHLYMNGEFMRNAGLIKQ